MLRARHVPVEREGYGGCGPTKRARLVEGGGVDQKGVGQSADSRRSPTSLESRLGPLPSKGRVLGAPRRIAGAGLLPRGNSSGSRPVTCTDLLGCRGRSLEQCGISSEARRIGPPRGGE